MSLPRRELRMARHKFIWMRSIDRWLGGPLIKFLGNFTSKPRSLYGDHELESFPEKVLCAQFLGLGSVVLSFPLLHALKKNNVKIAFLSFEGQAQVLRLSGLVDEIYVIQPSIRRFLPTLWKALRQARLFKPQAFLDFESTANFSAILGRLSGASVRLGFISDRSTREQLFTHLISLSRDRHRVFHLLSMGRRIGLSQNLTISMPPIPDLQQIKNILPDHTARRRIVVNIHPVESGFSRAWMDHYWVEVCNQLLQDISVDLIFPGGANERNQVQALIAKLKDPTRVFNVAGSVTLAELLRLICDAKLVVSVESGIIHLAAWVGTPIVALFGPESPSLYGPFTVNAKVLWLGLACSPCVGVGTVRMTHCQENSCMKRLTPEMVYRACISMLTRAKLKFSEKIEVA